MDILKDPTTIFILSSVVGMLAHYAKKASRGEVGSGVVAYFTSDFPKHSIAAFVTLAIADATFIMTGQAMLSNGLMSAAVVGLLTGYTSDSVANRGTA